MADYTICPYYEKAIEIIGKKWTPLILRTLMTGPKRFSELSRIIPQISAKMLADRMRELEECGVVKRKVFPETPVRVEYSLTEKGMALGPTLDAIQQWADEWLKKRAADKTDAV